MHSRQCCVCNNDHSYTSELQWHLPISIQEDILHHTEGFLLGVFNPEVLHQLEKVQKYICKLGAQNVQYLPHNMYQMICTCGRINLHRPVTSSVAVEQFVFQCTCGLQSQMAKKQTWIHHRTAICEGYTLLASQNAPPSFPLHRKASAQYSTNGAKCKHISCCTFVAQV